MIKGAVAFVLVSNSGVQNGLVHIYRTRETKGRGNIGDIGSMIMAELQTEMKTRHIPHSVTVPFPDSVKLAVQVEAVKQ